MPSWWDYLHFNRQYNNKRNLEEGLFQIASQTCNILVKVNNTNNINLTRNNRSDEYGCAGPPKGKSSMQICVPKFRKNSITSGCNPGLSCISNTPRKTVRILPTTQQKKNDLDYKIYELADSKHNLRPGAERPCKRCNTARK
ncbi:jg12217 [Pararge aegeria aegeria]|uniref:Jg12217 protein n=1 Tax=Pararge aegeria aegeria TaxID=348720 RepID=A0A8S4SBP7_9NEOP|nr:jg12217 [Pararge aegeria aegeria]